MNGSAAASNRAAAASFLFGDEDATNKRPRSCPSGLISAKTSDYCSRLGTFLRGTLFSTEKPVKTRKRNYSPKKCGRARTGIKHAQNGGNMQTQTKYITLITGLLMLAS